MEKGLAMALAIVCKLELESRNVSDANINGYELALDRMAEEIKKEFDYVRLHKSLTKQL
jgi:hypothetical protein